MTLKNDSYYFSSCYFQNNNINYITQRKEIDMSNTMLKDKQLDIWSHTKDLLRIVHRLASSRHTASWDRCDLTQGHFSSQAH